MILRPLEEDSGIAQGGTPQPIWPLIEASQSRKCDACWLITQPAHAALSAEMAEQLTPAAFGDVDHDCIRAIALHDAGWSAADAAAVQDSRAGKAPRSFANAHPAETLAAWTSSIETAGAVSALGGYLVSRHFSALAQHEGSEQSSRFGAAGAAFLQREEDRRRKLRAKLGAQNGETDSRLNRLVDALQFCDLLSLYLCCGLESPVVFPQQSGGRAIELIAQHGEWKLDPDPFNGRQRFSVEALRHPRGKGGESRARFTLFLG